MSQINTDLIKKVGKLARLKITDSEASSLVNDLTNIVGMIEKLQALPMDKDDKSSYTDRTISTREDIVTTENISEELATNAPKFKFNFFEVPKVIE